MKCPITKCDGKMTGEFSTKYAQSWICPKCGTIMTIPAGVTTSPESNDSRTKGHDKGD